MLREESQGIRTDVTHEFHYYYYYLGRYNMFHPKKTPPKKYRVGKEVHSELKRVHVSAKVLLRPLTPNLTSWSMISKLPPSSGKYNFSQFCFYLFLRFLYYFLGAHEMATAKVLATERSCSSPRKGRGPPSEKRKSQNREAQRRYSKLRLNYQISLIGSF